MFFSGLLDITKDSEPTETSFDLWDCEHFLYDLVQDSKLSGPS